MECLENPVTVSCFFPLLQDNNRLITPPSLPATRQEQGDTPRKRSDNHFLLNKHQSYEPSNQCRMLKLVATLDDI